MTSPDPDPDREEDDLALERSRTIDIGSCRSVCLTLGPYRNLTTLTAATLFLHPRCQVLNHAGGRIFGRDEVDFLADYSAERLDRFVQFAIEISTGGRRGTHGGSIVHSHAFDAQHQMRDLHNQTGGALRKAEGRCLFWKESLMTSQHIRESETDLGAIFEKDSRLRFICPVRNPMDCAVSNRQTGLVNTFDGLSEDSPLLAVVSAILAEFEWFAHLEQRFPGRFFHFFEHEVSRDFLLRLARFVDLSADEDWLDRAMVALRMKPSYPHDTETRAAVRAMIDERFSFAPPWREDLLKFVDAPADAP